MKAHSLPIALAILATGGLLKANEVRRLPVSEYRDRMAAGWLGQMAGVGWGAPTEFKFKGEIIPEDKVPQWKPAMINTEWSSWPLGTWVSRAP